MDEIVTFRVDQTESDKRIKLELEKEIKPYLEERKHNNAIFNYE